MGSSQDFSALSSAHWHQLCEALERLYTPTCTEQFPALVFEIITSLIPDSFMTFEDIDQRSGLHLAHFSRVPGNEADYRASLVINLPRDHPGYKLAAQGVTMDFCRLSDLISMRQLRQTGMYADQFQTVDVKYQLAVWPKLPGHVVGISVNRHADFSTLEAQVVQTLAPHISQAFANARLFTALQAAAEKTPTFTPEALCRHGITPREAAVLQWIIEGKRNPEIAIILAMSVRTVEKHCQNLFAKLGVETRIAAVTRAQEILQKARRPPLP